MATPTSDTTSKATAPPPSIDELVAREQIRELIASYTHLGDGGRLDELVGLFDPDATIDAHGRDYHGPDEILSFFTDIVDDRAGTRRRTYVRHNISNVTITFTGADSAIGASYWVVYSDDGFESSGRYRDEYRRRPDGTWCFARRKIRRDESRG